MVASMLLTIVAAGTLGFDIDWAAFDAGGDSARVEFYYSIPYDQLLYVDSAGVLEARFTVGFELTDRSGALVRSGEFARRARLGRGGFADAVRRRLAFVDAFSVTVRPGGYRYAIAVSDSTQSGVTRGRRDDTLPITAFGGRLSASSLQLGSRLVVDSATGAVSVIPNPGSRFGAPGPDTLYFYVEGYGFEPESDSYGLEIRLLSMVGPDTAIESGLLVRARSGPHAAAALGIGVGGVKPGNYQLEVTLTDFDLRRSVRAEKRLWIGPEAAAAGAVPRLEGLSDRERRYYREIQHLTTPRQLGFYQALTDSGKEAYLASFWQQRDLPEFARRMEVADSRFRRPRQDGVKTDRGRIYVKYGEPDAIEQKVIETDLRPREYWHYYGTGYHFIFIDLRSDGNYRLAWSSSREEPSTGLEQYLSPEEQNEYR